MFHAYMSSYFEQLQKYNRILWKEYDRSKESINTSINKAMYDMNMDDFTSLFQEASHQPGTLLKVQMKWWEQQLKIWQNLALVESAEPVVEADKTDRRFQDKSWQQDVFFNFIKQSYLLYSKTFFEMIESIEGLDPKVKERILFFSRQAINSMSPSNFVFTNPELLKLTLEKNGENLVNGLAQLRKDLETSADVLRISLTNDDAFQVGVQIGNTPGDIVFKNELFELIQYRPRTEQVRETPLLFVPPFINKYYILDLRENSSMIRWMLDQGYTVFTISWRNPGPDLAEVGIEGYVLDGVVKAVEVVEEITGQQEIHAAGYCIGGTLLACAVAYYAGKRMKPRIKTASYFTTLLDFSQPGEIGNYISEPIISALEMQNISRGYMDGRTVSVIFSLLRENSLYWNYFIDNYLKGNTPADFDLLYWNGDSTNITAAMHNFLLRELYLNNKLMDPRAIKIGGVYIDLKKIVTPSCFVSTIDDHIALWKATYIGALKPAGDTAFILGASGHIAGIINPPYREKYEHWVNENLCDTPEEWLKGAESRKGSWWPYWLGWLDKYSEETRVDPYPQGSKRYPVLGDAPGDYVRQKVPVVEEQTVAA